MAIPSMDFPVPGSPKRKAFLLCLAAFLIRLTPFSCPMTWSTIFLGTGMSAVVCMFKSSRDPFVDDLFLAGMEISYESIMCTGFI